MLTLIKELSSYSSPTLIGNMNGIEFKQFSRTYPGNYSVNFTSCLSGINDYRTKNFSNFYLTGEWRISEVFDYDDTPSKTSNIFGPISFGGNFLTFNSIDPTPYAALDRYQEHLNYGVPRFTTNSQNIDNFTILIMDNNRCNIYHTKNYVDYYLCVDSNNSLVFVKKSELVTDAESINPQDFKYQYSESSKEFVFFKKTSTDSYILTKIGKELSLIKVLPNNSPSYINSAFKVNNNLYNSSNIDLNTSFISYNTDNSIDVDKSEFNLTNNMLLHKKYSENGTSTDVIVLKNQLLQNDVFSSANNLLSGNSTGVYVNGLREYTSIGSQIDDETSESLELSYVFYNTPYIITPGETTFLSPSSMFPFSKININDTKFTNSGAFAFTTPEYSDKVYQISPDINNSSNDQHLLCTWLSGSPFGGEKIWVDRYYYPDLISKESAISSSTALRGTYDEFVEDLISSNTSLSADVAVNKFFDKKSDLIFEPNKEYVYSRIEKVTFPSLSSKFTYCSDYSTVYPNNYFKTINKAGEISMGFNFKGDNSSWTVKSDRNLIDSGINFVKNSNTLTISINIYDYTTYTEDDTSFLSHTIDVDIKNLKNNFVAVSIDTKSGAGYIFFNDEVVYNFNIPIYQIYIKQLIYGDFFLYDENGKQNLLDVKIKPISNVFINDYYIGPELVFLFSLSESNPINTIYITLPCGMRNSTDDVSYIHSICGSSGFKSNNINISVKNLNIDNETILDDVKEYISQNVMDIIPPNVSINSIQFDNYK